MDEPNNNQNQTPNTPSGTPMSPQDSAFWKFQANQFILLILFGAAAKIVSMFLIWIPIIGWLAIWVLYAFSVVCLILLIVNIITKKMKPLPIIGNLYNFVK